jgi:hypothetical protein
MPTSFYGPRDAAGEDTYVLCEINVSSVFAFPGQAHCRSRAWQWLRSNRVPLCTTAAKMLATVSRALRDRRYLPGVPAGACRLKGDRYCGALGDRQGAATVTVSSMIIVWPPSWTTIAV